MKKLLLLLLCVPLIGLGQNIKYTVFSGVNYSYPIGENIEDWRENLEDIVDLNKDLGHDASGGVYGKFGLNIGVNIDYNIKENISFSSGLSYSEKGFKTILKTVQDDIAYDMSNNALGNYYFNIEEKIDAKLNYIDFPILIKYHANDGYFISGGILLCFLLNESVELDYSQQLAVDYLEGGDDGTTDYSQSDIYTNTKEDWDDSLDDRDPEKTIIGAQLVLGYNISKYNLSLKINKTGDFGEIYNNDDNQNLTLQLCVGYQL